MATRYVTIEKFAELSRSTPNAVLSKIQRGIWPRDTVWVRSEAGEILIDVRAFEQRAIGRPRRALVDRGKR